MPPAPRYRWVLFSLLSASLVLRVPIGASLGILLPEISREFGLGPVEEGWLGSSLNVGVVVIGIPAAWLLSRLNPYRFFAIALAICSLLTLIQGFAPSYSILLIQRLLLGFVFAGLVAPRALLIQQWFAPREMPLTSGIQFSLIGLVEWITFAGTAGLSQVIGGWRGVWQLIGVAGGLVTVAWVWLGRENPAARPAPGKRGEGVSPLLILTKQPLLWVLGLGSFGAPACWWTFATFWPSYMLDWHGMPLSTSGFLFGLTSFGMIPGTLFVGWLCTHAPQLRGPVMLLSGLTLAATEWGMLLTDSIPALVVLGSVNGLAWGFLPVMGSIPFQLASLRPREIAVASSLLWTLDSVGSLIGPALAGVLIAQLGDPAFALGLLCTLNLGLLVSGVVLIRSGRQLSEGQLAVG